MKFTNYLNFNGNCNEAAEFYAETFGGKLTQKFCFEGQQLEQFPHMEGKIMNVTIETPFANLSCSDAVHELKMGERITLTINFKSEESELVKSWYDKLCVGGNINQEWGPAFFAKTFAMVDDKYDIKWMLICED